jgi:hypothetical protein
MHPTIRYLLTLAVLIALTPSAQATASHTYQPNEYLVIHDGLAPNKRHAIAAHGSGEDSGTDFHLFLMTEPAHKKLARLPDISSHNNLDSAPDAYTAAWSPDSRHVAVSWRSERHRLSLLLYRIDGRRIREIGGPAVLTSAVKLDLEALDEGTRFDAATTAVTWTSPKSFIMTERYLFVAKTPTLLRALGQYGRQTDDTRNDGRDTIEFSAQAECVLVSGDRYRIVRIKPGAFGE